MKNFDDDDEFIENDGWEDEEDDVEELGGSGSWGRGFGSRHNDDGDDSGWAYDDNDDDEDFSDGYSEIDEDSDFDDE